MVPHHQGRKIATSDKKKKNPFILLFRQEKEKWHTYPAPVKSELVFIFPGQNTTLISTENDES